MRIPLRIDLFLTTKRRGKYVKNKEEIEEDTQNRWTGVMNHPRNNEEEKIRF